MKKTEQIIIMNFSGIYRQQQFYLEQKEIQENISWVEVQDLPGSNCYCDDDAIIKIQNKIKEYGPQGLHFLDSGNYHYMSRIWMEKIDRPFRLVVFDNHTDMQLPAFGGILSCGGWIAASFNELPMLKEVILIGPDQEAYDQVEEEFKGRVRFLSREILKDMEKKETEAFLKSIEPDLPLYVSIDKDVLSGEYASTTWSQGDMEAGELIDYLELLMREQEIIGVDICGENDPDVASYEDINDHTNSILLAAWLKWRTQHEE